MIICSAAFLPKPDEGSWICSIFPQSELNLRHLILNKLGRKMVETNEKVR